MLETHRPALGGLLVVLIVVLSAAACDRESPEPETLADPITNATLNVSFADLPDGFEVARNDADGLWLRATDPEDDAELWLEVGAPSEFGIDLVALVNEQRADYEAMENGSYSGATKLVTPMGEAYNVRGQYEHEGARVEEARVFAVHPAENRLVTFHARYPAGGQEVSQERIGTLLAWVGELEALEDPYADAEEATDAGANG